MSARTRPAGWVSLGFVFIFLVAEPTALRSQEDLESTPTGGETFDDYMDAGDAQGGGGSHYVSLDVKEKDLRSILRYVSRRVGVNIIADPQIEEKVTVRLTDVEWREALSVIAREARCTLVEESDRLIRFSQPPSISMEFRDANIKVVLDLLAKQSGANIVHAPDVEGKVSLSLREVPWRDALTTIVKTAGFVLVEAETESSTEILRVMRPEALKQQLETHYFQLRYIRPDPDYRAVITGVERVAASKFANTGSSAGLESSDTGEDGIEKGFSLAQALKETISEDGTLQYDPHTNTFIVKDTRVKLAEISHIIGKVDIEPPQIYVEVKFISTSNNDILERGIKFDLPTTPERDGFQLIARGAEPNINAVDPLNFFGGTFPFDIGRIDNIPDDFQALGILDLTQTRLLLRMIKDDENSRIVQEPSLTMVNNKPATIFVGETIPFAVQKVQQDQNGNITVAIDENKRSPINVGFTLYLTPHVIPGTDMINLNVIPKVSTLSGTSSSIEGFERFQFQDAQGTTNSFIDLPRESAQTVVTYLRVHDGHTAVIGGLQTERKTEIETKVPILSSIPILGNLFTWKRKQNAVSSLIILITPHILKNVGDEDRRFNEALERHQKKDYFYTKYETLADESDEEPAFEE